MPKLVVTTEELAGKTFDLALDTTTVGRGTDTTIRIEDSTISHHHANIQINGNEVTVRDMNSTNGTRVNGQKIMEAKLTHGDTVRFGRIELRFEGEPKKTTSPLPKPTGGITVEEIGASADKPSSSFTSTSPFPKQKEQKRGVFQWVIIGLSLLAIVLLAFLLVKLM
ncbi:MAG: FHA domain-containing protein [Verrucomicrobiae bacterium]|nr:FHA domain-containing protein [Verrucomicrobiae bacterium]